MESKKIRPYLISISISIIVLDIILGYEDAGYFLREIYWFFLVPVLLIFNSKYNNKILNIILFIYEIFLFVCNLLNFIIFFYESTLAQFGVQCDLILVFLPLPDFIYYMLALFFQPLTVSIAVAIVLGIIKITKKSAQKN
ncbi:MAG: hypothetical protein J1E36_00225 [Eubacterium sp.]|nr:hypothetical protein [Eubacterium sp.]